MSAQHRVMQHTHPVYGDAAVYDRTLSTNDITHGGRCDAYKLSDARYTVVCFPHGETCGAKMAARAAFLMRNTASWCEFCAEESEQS